LLLTLGVLGGLDARKPSSDRMIRVTRQMHDAISIDGDLQRAGIRAIQSTNRRKYFEWGSQRFPLSGYLPSYFLHNTITEKQRELLCMDLL
jgi:hypothetical protein